MKIVEVTVSAGQTFNNPHESYSNFRPQITLKAVIEKNDDPAKIIRELQASAEGMIKEHKNYIFKQLEDTRSKLNRSIQDGDFDDHDCIDDDDRNDLNDI